MHRNSEKWATDKIAAHMAEITLCYECPDEVKNICKKRNNGGADCKTLFAAYLQKTKET